MSIDLPYQESLAVIQVFPFQNSTRYIQCLGVHLGNGVVATAGQCFLGARHCNKATITFPFSKNTKQKQPCQKVLAVHADESRYLGVGKDIAFFTIANIPRSSVNLNSDLEADLQPGMLLTAANLLQPSLGWPRLKPISGCKILNSKPVDTFLRPKSASTFSFTCDQTVTEVGTPLFSNKSKRLVGFYQATTKNKADPLQPNLPSPDIFYGKTFTVEDLKDNPHADVSIGNFSYDAFPQGIPSNIKLNAGVLNSSTGLVSFDVRNSFGALVKATDRNGVAYFFHSQQTTKRKPLRLQTPVTLTLESNAPEYFALIENITETKN